MFVICGEALIDMFVDNTQSNTYQFPLKACVGGSPFNVAIGLARLGKPVSLLTGLSNDIFGKRLSEVLEVEGVSQQLIVEKQLPTTVAFIEKDDEGVPDYLFLGQGAADRSLTLKDVDLSIETPTGIHLGSYTIVTQPIADSLLSLVKKYSGKCLISLDPNIRAVVEPDMKLWQDRVGELVKLADILKVSDEDLELMYPNIDPEEIVKKWLATGLKMAVLTKGGKGSTLYSAQGQVHIDTPKVTVVDTVGAGDTYQAAILGLVGDLIDEYDQSWSEQLSLGKLSEVGSYAAAAAAITCSRQGADLPSRDEITIFMNNVMEQ